MRKKARRPLRVAVGVLVAAAVGGRYTRKIKSKIRDGLALQSQGATR